MGASIKEWAMGDEKDGYFEMNLFFINTNRTWDSKHMKIDDEQSRASLAHIQKHKNAYEGA